MKLLHKTYGLIMALPLAILMLALALLLAVHRVLYSYTYDFFYNKVTVEAEVFNYLPPLVQYIAKLATPIVAACEEFVTNVKLIKDYKI